MQSALASLEPAERLSPPTAAERYLALDAMRGFVMLVLCWGVALDVTILAKNPAFRSFASQFRHVPRAGFGVWESMEPAFWFAVGAAPPFALARRRERGATFGANLRHASTRALKLILLGQILVCLGAGRIRVTPTETPTQLAICYFCCFLILQFGFRALSGNL